MCKKKYHYDSPCQENSIYRSVDRSVYMACPVCRRNFKREAGCKFVTCLSEYCQGQTHICMLCNQRVSASHAKHENCDGLDFLHERE